MPEKNSKGPSQREIFVTKSYALPALHQLGVESLPAEENFKIFGPCSRLHGHDYQVEVTVTGKVDAASGLLIRREQLDRIVEAELIERFKGRNLSHHFPHTTGEALAVEFYRLLKPHFPPPTCLSRLTVLETAKNSFFAGE
jgi:6-pyruvoyltetrahydropterin/6-carboxytetrahydropterin synthase